MGQEIVLDLTYVKVLLTVIAFLIAIVGYFVKKEIGEFGKRIDRHEDILFQMTGSVQRLIGYYEGNKAYEGKERRQTNR